jgi:3-hydroxyacyl-[acyl-carrier-protein] dehydratase
MSGTEAGLNQYALGGEEIRKFLPHRYPFLFIDRVVGIEPKGKLEFGASDDKVGTRVIARKNVSFNEPCFQGHFPGYAIFPGVLTIEAMAQASAFSAYPYITADASSARRGFSVILLGVDDVRFRKPVIPGDVLEIETVLEKCRGSIWSFSCKATVDGAKVAEAKILANISLEKDSGKSDEIEKTKESR